MSEKTATLKLTEREWFLLKNGFESSFVDDGSDDGGDELSKISGKVTAAWLRSRGADAGRRALSEGDRHAD